MSYCFMNLRASREGTGLEPDFPESVGFVLLADLPTVDWGVYEFNADVGGDAWTPSAPVGDKLARLIESGKRYPPALAIAREEVVQVFGDHQPSQSEFTTAYTAALRAHLSRQQEAPYLLVQALRDDTGYLSAGEWYWALRIHGSPQVVSWVSDDFQVYENPVNDFDLTGQQLKQLAAS